MKKKITFLFAMLAGLVTTAMADNVISADPLTVTQNGTAELTINLTNTDKVRGLQFTLTLPEGVTVESLGDGDVAISYGDGNQTYTPTNGLLVSTTDRTTNWWALGNKVGDDYKFVLLNPKGDGVAALEEGADAAIMKITFKAASGSTGGNVVISDIHMSIEGSTEDATQADVTIEDAVTVSNLVRGDVNKNGSVEIGDAVCILRYLAEKSNNVFDEEAGDVNDNNKIDIGDAVLVLKYLANKIDALSRRIDNDSDTDMDAYDPD